jgi:hypothetical protein
VGKEKSKIFIGVKQAQPQPQGARTLIGERISAQRLEAFRPHLNTMPAHPNHFFGGAIPSSLFHHMLLMIH